MLVQSKPYSQLLHTFAAEKRPITAEVLRRISLERVADALGLKDSDATFTQGKLEPRMQLALGLYPPALTSPSRGRRSP